MALLDSAHRQASANRAALEMIATALFDAAAGALSDEDRSLMENALKVLVREIEGAIRRELAERHGAPRELAAALDRDGAEVAYPVLAGAGFLRNAELIEVVKHRVQTHRLAVALGRLRRDSAAADDADHDSVIQTLLSDAAPGTLESLKCYLAAESGRVDTFQNPLIRPVDLPAEVSPSLWWGVSAALRQHATENYDAEPAVLDRVLEQAPAALLARIEAEQGHPDEADSVIDHLTDCGRFSPDVLVRLLRQGEVPLFEAAFARATGLRPRLVSRLLYEPGGEGLALACKAVGFDGAVFSAIYESTRLARMSIETPGEGGGGGDDQVAFFESIDADTAMTVLERWRRNADYLYAIKQVEQAAQDRGSEH